VTRFEKVPSIDSFRRRTGSRGISMKIIAGAVLLALGLPAVYQPMRLALR
jgi:hypothetical protein